mgnify:CR=1 FL=1
MSTITLSHVNKTFVQQVGDGSTRITAIRDVSFKVAQGEVLAIIGPSGSGKSTLLRLIAGLAMPDSGDILYDNVPLDQIEPMQRGIGMVFQDGALMPHWETRKSVGFFLWLRRRDHEVPARMQRIAQITGIGLDQLLERRPSQLSGGERQRVGVARALARDPRLFLFDEPFSNIDAKLRGSARIELRRLLNEFPVTSVYVTHDQHEAIALSDRIAVMDEGQIVQIGTYQQLYTHPLNQFVAQFMGTPPINIVAGHVDGHRWHGRTFSGFEVRHDLADGTAVNLGFRADAVFIDDDGENAVVREITPFYAERYQWVEVESMGDVWRVQLPLEFDVRVRDIIKCALNPDLLYFFDAKTGRRIG